MVLYIVRHAYAGQNGDPRWPDDTLRPLTKKGRKRFSRMIKWLGRGSLRPTAIGTSPLVRCRQTAEILAERLDLSQGPEVVEEFAPGCRSQDVLRWALETGGSAPAYVGHAPDVSHVAAAWLGCMEDSIHFAKGAIAAIEFADQPAAGTGVLLWLVTPKNFA